MPIVLMADDDTDDCELVAAAFSETASADQCDLRFARDGVELLQYLRGEGQYSEPGSAPRPGLILLDLNMPKLDGREALAKIKKDPKLRRIPIVVLSTSRAEEDIQLSYDSGAAGYIPKPQDFGGLLDAVSGICAYWHDTVLTSPNGE